MRSLDSLPSLPHLPLTYPRPAPLPPHPSPIFYASDCVGGFAGKGVDEGEGEVEFYAWYINYGAINYQW